MRIERHDAVGIKQILRLEWLEYATSLMFAGFDAKAIRVELLNYISNKGGSGEGIDRGETSTKQVVTMLMNIWVTPDKEIEPFRSSLLERLRDHSSNKVAIHWSMVSAAYPFWFRVAHIVGRLLAIQPEFSKSQAVFRLTEIYGDRETVTRYARSVIRSFVAWGLLSESKPLGNYKQSQSITIVDFETYAILIESILLATPSGKGSFDALQNHPSLFPFKLPLINSSSNIVNERLDVSRFSLNEEYLSLK